MRRTNHSNVTVVTSIPPKEEDTKKYKKIFKFEICEETFTQKNSMEMHVAKVHEGKKNSTEPTISLGFHS